MGFLDALAPYLDTAASGLVAHETGRRERAAQDQADALAALEQRARQAAAERQARLDALNERNTLSLIREREDRPTNAPTYGTGLTKATGPDGKLAYVQASSAGGVRPVEGYTPIEEPAAPAPGSPAALQAIEAEAAARARGTATGSGANARVAAATRTKMAENVGQLKVIDDAIAALDARPESVGLKRGLGIIPGLGGLEDPVNQHVDPGGIDARALVANIGSLLMHDRSGAAVSVSEFPRLAPFIPSVRDTAEAAKIKLRRLREQIVVIQAALDNGATIDEVRNGVTSAPVASPPSAGVPASTVPPPGGFAAWKAARSGGRP